VDILHILAQTYDKIKSDGHENPYEIRQSATEQRNATTSKETLIADAFDFEESN